MLLDNNTRSLKMSIAAPISSEAVVVTAEYIDIIREAQSTKVTFNDIGAPALAMTIIEAPPANTERHIVELHINNKDDASHQFTVYIDDGGTNKILQNVVLDAGDTLHYNRYRGWSITVAGAEGRGAVMKRVRTVTANAAVDLLDDLIYVDATGGNVTITFDPAIVTGLYVGFAKEVEICKIDVSANLVFISDGVNNIDVINTPINGNGGNGGAKFANSDGTALRTQGVG